MTATITLKLLDEANTAVLYRHYDHELTPQECFVDLDLEDATLTADWNAVIGSRIPESVYSGRVIRVPIPVLTAAAANQLMRKIEPLAARVVADARVEWDGSCRVGILGADARQAVEELIAHVQDLDHLAQVEEVDAGEYFDAGEYRDASWPDALTAHTTDAQLESLAAEAETEVRGSDNGSGNYLVLVGAVKALRARREELREAVLQ